MQGPVAAAEKPPRIASLDVLRGLTIVGMIVVNSAAYLHYVSGYAVFPILMHSDWAGFTLADAVFPAFIFMTGVSIALSMPRGGGLDTMATRRLAVRALRLVLLGLLVSNLYWLATPELVAFRPMGVLQRIAAAFFVAAVLYRTTGPRVRLILAAAILLLYWPLCLLPSPDGTPANLDVGGLSFVAWFDRAALGGHAFVKGPLGYDPEGLMSTLPAIAQALIGVAAGEWLLARRGALGLAAAGLAMLAVGCVWSFGFPVIKGLWTSSYVLVSSGVALLALAGLHRALDVEGWRPPATAMLTDFGVNAVFAYVLHELASIILTAHVLKIPYAALSPLTGARTAALIPVAVFVALLWAVLAYMRRRGWIVKV